MLDFSPIEEAYAMYSDAFKDVHGIRPRGQIDMDTVTLEFLQEEIKLLGEIAEKQEKERIARQAKNANEFENRVSSMISDFSIDRETAIRWLSESYDGDIRWMEYDFDLPYNYIK